ncbi:uncharacterized protein VTP21DRAFT_3290 [Calcarisporiella thermophila]|uniref:uncharacterized protein n=1 Tax=Calcarisporiella thermophila TaxID=911321 RepID=UPI0037444C59
MEINPQCEGNLRGELMIIVRKQLSNPLVKVKKAGVLGALAIVKQLGAKMACIEMASSSQSANQALSHKSLSEAVSILNLVRDSCQKSMEAMSLAYDELALITKEGGLDERLVFWIKDQYVQHFTDEFISDQEEVQEMCEKSISLLKGMSIDTWMNLDADDSVVAVKLYPLLCGKLGILPTHPELILCLCSMFKLLQACEKALNAGSLDEIDALLGCGILMYKKFEHNDSFTPEMIEAACNALLMAINWFRELLNAFASQKGHEIEAKIIARIRDINSLEDSLNNMLGLATNFFPLANLGHSNELTAGMGDRLSLKESLSLNGAKPRRPNNSKKAANSRPDLNSASMGSRKSVQPSFSTIEDLRPFFRELEMDVFKVLRVGLDPQINSQTEGEQILDLGYPELKYLLRDLNCKLEYLLPPPVTNPFFARQKQKSQSQQWGTEEDKFALVKRQGALAVVKQVIDFLPFILRRLEAILEEIEDENRITEEDDQSQNCFAMLLQSIEHLFSWPELKSPDNRSNLMQLLTVVASRIRFEGSPSSHSLRQLVTEAFNYFAKFSETVPTASIAVILHRILSKILSLGEGDSEEAAELRETLSNLAEKYLGTEWVDRSTLKSETIVYLLRQQISNSKQPLETMEYYITTVLPALSIEDSETLEKHPLLTRHTYVTHFKAIEMELVSVIESFDLLHYSTTEECIAHIHHTIDNWSRLTVSVRGMDHRPLFSVTLRYGRIFLERFLRSFLPYLARNFKAHKESVVVILRNLQTSTRTFQIVCGHVKVIKDRALASLVPPIRKAMETIIFQVKAMLQENNCPSEAFYLGSLKHRDLITNEVISSQIPIDSSDEEVRRPAEMEEIEEDEEEEEEEEEVDQLRDDSSGTQARERSRPSNDYGERQSSLSSKKIRPEHKASQSRQAASEKSQHSQLVSNTITPDSTKSGSSKKRVRQESQTSEEPVNSDEVPAMSNGEVEDGVMQAEQEITALDTTGQDEEEDPPSPPPRKKLRTSAENKSLLKPEAEKKASTRRSLGVRRRHAVIFTQSSSSPQRRGSDQKERPAKNRVRHPFSSDSDGEENEVEEQVQEEEQEEERKDDDDEEDEERVSSVLTQRNVVRQFFMDEASEDDEVEEDEDEEEENEERDGITVFSDEE